MKLRANVVEQKIFEIEDLKELEEFLQSQSEIEQLRERLFAEFLKYADYKNAGEWNKAKIMVYKGTVVHGQNDENVLEYHLWTREWTDLLQSSKFSEQERPLAFQLLNNCGGDNREGFIGFQDHGDDVWYRNIRIKILD